VSRAAAPVAWESWLRLPGVFDLAGPRRDGRLVAAAHGRLVLVDPARATTREFAPTYSAPDGAEAYLALARGERVESAGCAFAADDVFALDLKAPPLGITRITAEGEVTRFASIPGVTSLSGITIDDVGTFGHRLLVIGGAPGGGTRVAAVDCTGGVQVIGTANLPLEGGIAVAPPRFGAYGGFLIAPNELDGSIYAVSSDGVVHAVAASGVPVGGDIGVESAGFVPARGAAVAYLADRGTPGNPRPGTDTVLRLDARALVTADARPGDLLVATEGGATVVRVRCRATCEVATVATGPSVAHGEGRLLVVPSPVKRPAVARSPSGRNTALVITVPLIGLLVALTLVIRRRRARRLPETVTSSRS
jgi:hypothetical protein